MKQIIEPELLQKYPLKTIDGEEMIDITHPIYDVDGSLVIIDSEVIVTSEYAGRLAIASKQLYGSFNSMEALMEANNVSNPFSLDTNELISIPAYDSFVNNIKIESIDQENRTQKDFEKRFEKDKERLLSNVEVSELRSPNIAPSSLPPEKFFDGKIELGSNVSNSGCKDATTSSSYLSEKIKKAITAKITN